MQMVTLFESPFLASSCHLLFVYPTLSLSETKNLRMNPQTVSHWITLLDTSLLFFPQNWLHNIHKFSQTCPPAVCEGCRNGQVLWHVLTLPLSHSLHRTLENCAFLALRTAQKVHKIQHNVWLNNSLIVLHNIFASKHDWITLGLPL